MSDYLYAVIPYKSGMYFDSNEEEPCIWGPVLPELKDIDSEFVEIDGLTLFEDFLMINTCYRQSAFTNNKNGYNWIRAEICQIARALGAHEVWYVAELATDEMHIKGFSFDDWVQSFKNGERYACELNVDVLKKKYIFTYYHDDFSDIIMEKPE